VWLLSIDKEDAVLTDKEKQQPTLGEKRPGESFKDQILRALHDDGANEPVNSSRPTQDEAEAKLKSETEKSPTTDEKDSKVEIKMPLSDESKLTRSKKKTSDKKSAPKEEISAVESEVKPMTRAESKKQASQTSKKQGRNEERNNPEIEEAIDPRDKEDKIVSRIVLIVVAALVIVVGIVGFTGYRYVDSALKPLDSTNKNYVSVNIPIGSSNKEIGHILEQDKVIKNGMIFNYYTKFHNLANFQGGYYNMQPSMSLEDVANLLQQGGTEKPEPPVLGKILIPEGFSIEQIAQAMEVNALTKKKEKTPYTSEEFMKVVQDPAFFDKMLKKYPELLTSASQAKDVRYRLEGYLFPATYNYSKGTTVEQLVEEMITAENQVMSAYYGTIKAKGMTVQEVLTLASLVEKEGVKDEDRREIAQVFFNRMTPGIDMPLQSDISVLYAMNQHKELLTEKDTQIDSPYNLYIHTGYGPGPFDSPGKNSIEAVLNPKDNDYLFFVADIKTGEVYFAKTYEEHQELVDKYVNN
jgi:UPF0755 protein